MRRCCSVVQLRRISAPSTTATTEPAKPAKTVPISKPKPSFKDAPTIKPPHYRKIHRYFKPKHLLQNDFLTRSDLSGAGARLYDYKRTGEIAASLSNISERIDFVSPYERPWTRAEETWRRDWHPTLMATRKAWALPQTPAYFDVLNFYKYITKTDLAGTNLDEIYKDIVLPYKNFEVQVMSSLSSHLESTRFDSEEERVAACLASLMDEAVTSIAPTRPALSDYRLSYESKSESFWIRSGFSFLYDQLPLGGGRPFRKLWNNQKYIGDDRRKLGELAFVHRDKLAATLRRQIALPPIIQKNDTAVTPHSLEMSKNIAYTPRVFNLWPDENPLWQCPGFFADSDETHTHTVMGMKSLAGLRNKISKSWEMEKQEAEDTFLQCAQAQAIVSAFSMLAATAHVHGFTQYNDISPDSSFSTQLILSDGRDFFFTAASLNTLAINVNIPGFDNPLWNSAIVEGPLRLYDSYENGEFITDGKKGLNKAVLERILQMTVKSTSS